MMSDKIKPFSKVAVLYGGSSSEREISLITGKAVFESLQSKGVKAILIDTIEPFVEALKTEKVSHAWIALHGSDGEDTAKFEIDLWFNEEELCEWETSDSKWRSEN